MKMTDCISECVKSSILERGVRTPSFLHSDLEATIHQVQAGPPGRIPSGSQRGGTGEEGEVVKSTIKAFDEELPFSAFAIDILI